MKKKIIGAALALACAAVPCGVALTGCNNGGEGKEYNIVATQASIPPVIAALDCIKNGNDTYAFIERGKTYSGIGSVAQFQNLGFDPTKNENADIVNQMNSAIGRAIEQIQGRDSRAKFTIYCRDYSAMAIYATAIKAGLKDDQFRLVMVEDGSGAYSDAYKYYVQNIKASDEVEDPAYVAYQERVNSCKAQLKTIRDSHGQEGYVLENHESALALASLGQFSYIMQTKTGLKNELDKNAVLKGSKLYGVFGIEDMEGVEKANISYRSISEYVESLNATQKENYLTLMFGADRAVTDQLFTRTKVGDATVPSKKLVFIGTRVKSSSTEKVANMTDIAQLVSNYDDLDEAFKEVFMTKEDYDIMYNALTATSLSDGAKLFAANMYMEYVYELKLTLRLYGDTYDILYKGHPSEVINVRANWQDGNYTYVSGVSGEANEYVTQVMFDMVNSFYKNDSEGKLVGILPGGVAAENFAYLGYDFVLGGLSSSTYKGYEASIQIEFAMLSGKSTLANESNLQTRYDNGTLVWDRDNQEFTTLILNQGNTYKALMEKYTESNPTLSEKYKTAYEAWLIANSSEVTTENVGNFTIDTYGNIVNKNA